MNSLRRQIIKALSITGLGLGFSQPLLARRGMGGGSISSFIFTNTAIAGTDTTTTVQETLVSNTQVLKIPKLDTGEIIEGKRVFNLNIAKASSEFFKGIFTETVGINQAFLGTTLRARRDETVQLNITNQLGEITTVHWHGMHLPPSMDGGPHQAINQNETWRPEFKIDQQATTLWYHSHTHEKTGEQVYRGQAGMFILDDDNSEQLALPSEYGVDDIPLIIQDRRFNSDGSFQYLSSMRDRMMGMKGDTILVNGTLKPVANVERRLIRLRLLNGSNARIYNFGFSDNRKFDQIASDGGFLEQAVSLERLRLSPGERAEILVDFQDGRQCSLQSFADSSAGISSIGASRRGMFGNIVGSETTAMQDDETINILDFNPIDTQIASHTVPTVLNTISRLKVADAQTTRSFTLSMDRMRFAINGKSMDMMRIDETIPLGATEIWEVTNNSEMTHSFHVHDVQYQILSRNGETPAANEQGWKDTIIVDPMETVQIIMQFKDYADANIPYMYHCHILEHEDQGMMGQFLVI
jgi:FtsP/CotA-like multicopper oxidase with cupredoxin domain